MTLPNSNEYIVSVEFPHILKAIEKLLKPQNRGFRLVYSGLILNNDPAILYQSDQCKMKIACSRDRPYDPLETHVSYGRIHAELDKYLIEWNGEECYCWHNLQTSPLLHFLDGISPADAVQLVTPKILKEVFDSSKEMKLTGPEYLVWRQAMIWERYEQRFFNLLDLHYPDLWQEYVSFFKEYDRLGRERGDPLAQYFDGTHRPRRYQIC